MPIDNPRNTTHKDTFVLGRTYNVSPTPRAVWYVTADIRLGVEPGTLPTVDHTSVVDPQYIAISFNVGMRRAGSDWDEAINMSGQVPSDHRRIQAKPDARKIRQHERDGHHLRHIIDILWREWHLNNMHAGCSHQDVPAQHADRDAMWLLDHVRPCMLTGYRWGSQWLIKPLNEDALSRISLLDLTPVEAS